MIIEYHQYVIGWKLPCFHENNIEVKIMNMGKDGDNHKNGCLFN